MRQRFAFLLFVVLTSSNNTFAHVTQCAGRVAYIHAFSSAFDQQQSFSRAMLESTPADVSTSVAPAAVGITERYLVIVQDCDAFVHVPTQQRSAARGGVSAQAVVIPDDHPYRWQLHPSIETAAVEFLSHSDAATSGLERLGDGTFIVYWSTKLAE